MTVKDLKEILACAPDDAVILTTNKEQNFRHVKAQLTTGLYDHNTETWAQDYGEGLTPERDFGRRFQIIVIS